MAIIIIIITATDITIIIVVIVITIIIPVTCEENVYDNLRLPLATAPQAVITEY